METIETRDTDLAAALLSRGARLRSWWREPGTGIVHWTIADIRPGWVDDYKTGRDGCKYLIAARKNLVRIAASFPQSGGLACGVRHDKTDNQTNPNMEK